ncbi:phage holin family protein [Actinomyces trachealis]|uniref:phage holin family protein n=1 Tax=Actinomyces trachealis TaxID=2763540 RepID=UPI001892CA20|nr:phage holin family protein [Actinomyces trachealis]
MELIVRSIGNAAGLWLATIVLTGVDVPGSPSLGAKLVNLFVVGLVFALVNSIVKPLIRKLTFPLYLLTFGLFSLVVNGMMLKLTSWLTDHLVGIGADAGVPIGLHVETMTAAIVGAIIISLVSALVVGVIGRKDQD